MTPKCRALKTTFLISQFLWVRTQAQLSWSSGSGSVRDSNQGVIWAACILKLHWGKIHFHGVVGKIQFMVSGCSEGLGLSVAIGWRLFSPCQANESLHRELHSGWLRSSSE